MKRNWSDPTLREARVKSLLAGDPTRKFGIRAGLDETLPMTMSDIQGFLEKNYGFDCNPLDHLRVYFHLFEWKFFKRASPSQTFRIVTQADYAWLKNPNADYSMGIVTAKSVTSRTPKGFFFIPWTDTDSSGLNRDGWPDPLYREAGRCRAVTSGAVFS